MVKQFSIILFLAVIGSACNNSKTETKPTVSVTVIPQQFFVNKIAGNWLAVNVMIPPGGNPHTYEPTPMQMKALSKSSAYLRIGHLSFESAWMDKLASVSSNMKIYDTSVGLNLIGDEDGCEQDGDHDHHHEAYNPHIWLSPLLVKEQVVKIYEALNEMYPENGEAMKLNLDRFVMQIDSVHQQLNTQLKNAEGSSFIVYHPVWTYMARDYKLNEVAIELNGKEATADKLKKIIDLANEKNIRVIFVQKEFSDAQARTIANEIKGKVLTLDPLNYDWFNTMKEFGEAF
jgi:zinc transport system substrate-binding protein